MAFEMFKPQRGRPSLSHSDLTKHELKIIGKYGDRPRILAGHGDPLKKMHFRGVLQDGRKFVYCPVGLIVSWSAGDYDHEWCHWCKKYFQELNSGRK